MELETLAEKIDETRITYEHLDHGTRIHGTTFSIEFDDPVDPETFCETVSDPEEPWKTFGLKLKLADERTDEDGNVVAGEYWKLSGVLFHVEGGEPVDSSKITLEVTPEWARVYVKEGCCEHRAAEFIQTIDEEYGVEVQFASDLADTRGEADA